MLDFIISCFFNEEMQAKEKTIPKTKLNLNRVGKMPSIKYPFIISKDDMKDVNKNIVARSVNKEIVL